MYIDSVLKRSLGWVIITFGIISYLFICVEWSTGIRVITPTKHEYSILYSILIYSISPIIIGTILLIRFKRKEVFLEL